MFRNIRIVYIDNSYLSPTEQFILKYRLSKRDIKNISIIFTRIRVLVSNLVESRVNEISSIEKKDFSFNKTKKLIPLIMEENHRIKIEPSQSNLFNKVYLLISGRNLKYLILTKSKYFIKGTHCLIK